MVLLLASGKSGVREWENFYPNTEFPEFLDVTLLAKALACYMNSRTDLLIDQLCEHLQKDCWWT